MWIEKKNTIQIFWLFTYQIKFNVIPINDRLFLVEYISFDNFKAHV